MKFYFPIEFFRREFNSKLFLSSLLLHNNSNSICLGNSDILIDRCLRGEFDSGIILIKSMQLYIWPKLLLLRILGFKVFLLEEESWVPFNDFDIKCRRLPVVNQILINGILCPNQYFFELKSYSKKLLFGHPRINVFSRTIIKPSNRPISEKILLISSFGFVNNLNPNYSFLNTIRQEIGWLKFLLYQKRYQSYYEKVKKDFDDCRMVYHMLTKMGFKVSYRPHPSENTCDLDMTLSQYNLPIEKDAVDYGTIIHFGSTIAFDLELLKYKGNIVCYSDKSTLDILTNSKLSGIIIHDISKLSGIISSPISCVRDSNKFLLGVSENSIISFFKEIDILKFYGSQSLFKGLVRYIYRVVTTLRPLKFNLSKGNINQYIEVIPEYIDFNFTIEKDIISFNDDQ